MNNQGKAAFLTKPNIAISKTGEHANLTFGQLASGNETWRGDQHNRTGSGIGVDDLGESSSGSEQHPEVGAPIQRSRSFQARLDRYVKEHERQLSFSDSPSPPHSSSPPKIQSSAWGNSSSEVTVFDPASGGSRALVDGHRREGNFGALQYGDPTSSSTTVANPPPGMPHPNLQDINTATQTAYPSGIPTIPGALTLFMQPNGLLGPPTSGTHHMMPQLPSGAPPWNLPYVDHQYGPFMNPYPGDVLYPYPYSVPIHQQSDQTHFATGTHIPQNGYRPSSLPPFGVPQIAPSTSTTLHQTSPPDSKENSPAVKNHQPAVNSTQTPGSVHLAPNGQQSLPVSVAQHTTASSSTSSFAASASSSGHEIARSAPNPNPRLAPTPATTPAALNFPSATIKPQSYPQPRAPPSNDILGFPQAKPNLQGSVIHATSRTQPGISGGNEGQKVSRDVQPKVPEHLHQHTYPAGVNRSNEEESGNFVEGMNRFKLCSCYNLTDVLGPNDKSYVPLLQPPSSNEISATPTVATQTATSSPGDLDNSDETRETAMGNGVDSQTESRQASQEISARASTALAAKSNWADQDPSKPPVERPLTNAERFAMKLAKAELAEDEKEDAKDNYAMIQAPMPLHSDAAQWPSLSESSLVGKKGKTKKGVRGDLKASLNPGSGSRPRLQYLPAGVLAQVDWSIIRPQVTTNLGRDIASRPETNANPKDNSYFASNGSAPLAKDKDSLAKLFEKYRG